MTTLTIEHIARTPGICGGKPRIAGKGIAVQYIAALYNADWTVDSIAEEFDLTPGQIHAALSYYFDHKDEIDQAIRDDQVYIEQVATSLEEVINQMKARKDK